MLYIENSSLYDLSLYDPKKSSFRVSAMLLPLYYKMTT